MNHIHYTCIIYNIYCIYTKCNIYLYRNDFEPQIGKRYLQRMSGDVIYCNVNAHTFEHSTYIHRTVRLDGWISK